MKRTIAIGDIHGCSKALRGLLDAIQPNQADLLIFLGDYVDRGPDSRGVLDVLIDLQKTCETVFLLGNHEIMFRGVLKGLPAELWLQIGGGPTVTSYGGRLENVNQQHRDFLGSCVSFHETENHLFVHANYIADLPLAEQPENTLFWEHLTDRIPEPHVSGKHVFCGHTPQAYGTIGRFGHFTCLDTGCFAGYWLSAMDVDTQECWQVSREGHLRENWRVAKKLWFQLKKYLGK